MVTSLAESGAAACLVYFSRRVYSLNNALSPFLSMSCMVCIKPGEGWSGQ